MAIKTAASRTNPAEEYASQYLHGLNPIGIFSNIGGIIQAIRDPPHENADKSGADNLMPSVGAYRMVSRIKSQAYAQDKRNPGGHAKDNYLSELLGGTFTSGATPTILGGLIGAYLSRGKLLDPKLKWSERGMGTMKGIGAGVGVATVANLGALIASAITKRRTEREQVEHDRRSRWENWIIPGPGMYNKGKRIGRSEGDFEEGVSSQGTFTAREEDGSMHRTPAYIKALAMILGAGMTGYGLYKIPAVVRSRVNKVKEIAG